METLNMELGAHSYKITIGNSILSRADEFFNLERKVLIVTDSGVPSEYAEKIASLSQNSKIIVVEQGENSKSIETLSTLLKEMCDFQMGRKDVAVAVGGGVVGDLTGFASSVYMRGIDFYNVPTTLLAQVDSSIGGKTAINFNGIKNIVGAFHQPKAVLIDTEVLKSLDQRQIANGLAESVKMSLTSDAELFSLFEKKSKEEILASLEEIIIASLKIKRDVVQKDEQEAGLRKILNFGHTYGHGIEASAEDHKLFHGECVALGMIPMCNPKIRQRVIDVLKKSGLPTEYSGDVNKALSLVSHDKKCDRNKVSAIMVDEIGKCRICDMEIETFCDLIKKNLNY